MTDFKMHSHAEKPKPMNKAFAVLGSVLIFIIIIGVCAQFA